MILAEAPLSAMKKVVNFFNESREERPERFGAIGQERGERRGRINSGLDGGFPNQPFAFETFFDTALDLLFDPFVEREEASWVVVQDILLLLLKEV